MWHDISQNTDQWLDLRAGKVTGSAIGKIMANYGNALGEPAKKLAVNIAVERVTGKRVETDHYMNAHMERGHQEEPIARGLYEDEFFVDIENGGFYDNGNTGCSPDGRVIGNGLIEIKSVIATTHYATIKRGIYDPTYKWQYFFNIQEAKVDWLDFVSYCSSFPEHNNLYVYRIHREDIAEELAMMKKRLEKFEDYVSGIMSEINQ